MHGHMNINFKVRLLIVYKFYKCNWYTEYWTHYSTHYRVEKPTIYSRLDPDEYILQRILLFVKLRFNIILSVRPSFPSSLFLSDTCRSSWHHKHTHTHTHTHTQTHVRARLPLFLPFSLFYRRRTYIRFIPDVGISIQGHTVSMSRWQQTESCWLTWSRHQLISLGIFTEE